MITHPDVINKFLKKRHRAIKTGSFSRTAALSDHGRHYFGRWPVIATQPLTDVPQAVGS